MPERLRDDWRSLIFSHTLAPLRFDTTKPLRPRTGGMTKICILLRKCPADILLYLVPVIDLRYPAYLLGGRGSCDFDGDVVGAKVPVGECITCAEARVKTRHD